jgi:hypothetical protein
MLHQNVAQPMIIITSDINEATHWMPMKDERWMTEGAWSGVTPDKHYRLFCDKLEGEHVIVNDRGQLSVIYMAHEGLYLIYDYRQPSAENKDDQSEAEAALAPDAGHE